MIPLSASLTAGYHFTRHNGFRQDLRSMLIKDGFSIYMVGSRKKVPCRIMATKVGLAPA